MISNIFARNDQFPGFLLHFATNLTKTIKISKLGAYLTENLQIELGITHLILATFCKLQYCISL